MALVYLTRAIVDSLVAAMKAGGGWEAVQPTVEYIVIMATLMVAQEVLRQISLAGVPCSACFRADN